MKFEIFCDSCNKYLGIAYYKNFDMSNKHYCDEHCASISKDIVID